MQHSNLSILPGRGSTLISADADGTSVRLLLLDGFPRPGGLAVWQANRALKYIEGNLASKIAIREIADCVELSESHFSRAFKRSLGSAPIAYVTTRRVERAQFMMTTTRQSLTDIALACGFADQSHFSRSFRRLIGMSPGLWRRTLKSFQPIS